MDGWIEAITQFVAAHQGWLPVIMALFAAAETIAIVSLAVPSTAILVGVGALAATGVVPFAPLWIGASIGAIFGSTVSYWLGQRHGHRILGLWPLRDKPELVVKTHAAFARYGAATVFIGHFAAFLRPVVFLLAGLSGMAFGRFLLWNTIGCMAWAYAVPKLGQVGGDLIGWVWSLV